MKIFKRKSRAGRKPRIGDTYGEYTVILIGYRGTERVYICKSDEAGGNIFLKTEEELREERSYRRSREKGAAGEKGNA